PAVESLRDGAYRGAIADVRAPVQLADACDRLLEGTSLRHVIGLAGRQADDEPDAVEKPLEEGVRGFEDSLALNLTGQYALIYASVERLEAGEGDRSITLCSSVNALQSYGAPGYSAAKAGLIGMMNTLSVPFARRGIRINVVAPGTIRTPLTETLADKALATFDRKAKRVPLGRIGKPDDVAAVIEAPAPPTTHSPPSP